MPDTNQLPEPDLGYIKTDISNQPAFSARQMREAMTHTNKLPPLPTPKFTETIRGVPCITVTEHEHLMRAYALQACSQVQGEPMAWMHWLNGPVRVFMNKDEAMMELDRLNREYPVDSGDRKMRPLILGDTTPQPAQATQAEVTPEEVMRAAKEATAPEWQDVVDGWHMGLDLMKFTSLILALRPAAVPMTDAAREHFLRGYESAQQDALVCQLPPEGWACTRTAGHEGPCAAVPTDEGAFVKRGMDRLRESHNGITAQAKKETP